MISCAIYSSENLVSIIVYGIQKSNLSDFDYIKKVRFDRILKNYATYRFEFYSFNHKF